MLNTSYASLTFSQRDFVAVVCISLNANSDAAQVAVLGDGSVSANGERFAARRLGHSWEVVFNFPETQTAYETSVQLPVNWRVAA
jgi:hypothetical protein